MQLDGVAKDMQLPKMTKLTQFIGKVFSVLRLATIIFSLLKAKYRWFKTQNKMKNDWESRKSSNTVKVVIARTEAIERTRSILGVEDAREVALLAGTGVEKRIEC